MVSTQSGPSSAELVQRYASKRRKPEQEPIFHISGKATWLAKSWPIGQLPLIV